MSGEFGSCSSGYFHTQIETAAQDCLGGDDALTRLWGAFLHEFAPVARAISWSEASDSGPDYPITETLHRLPALRRRLDDIENYLRPFRAVADAAVRAALEEQRTEE